MGAETFTQTICYERKYYWAIYCVRSGNLLEFTCSDDTNNNPTGFPALTVDKRTFSILSNPWNWHSPSQKFSSYMAEQLYNITLVSFHDDECGNVDMDAWYALFHDERAILRVNSQGFVDLRRYTTREEVERTWGEIKESAYPEPDEQDCAA